MRSTVVRPVVLALVLVVPFSAVAAQQDSVATAQAPRQVSGPWFASLGVNSNGLNLATARPGTRAELFGSVGRHWSLWRGSSVRVQAIGGWQLPRALTLNEMNGCGDCEVWSTRQFVGVNAALTYEWRQGKAFRPYVLGGPGLVYQHSKQRLEAPCRATGSCTFVDPYLESWSRSGSQLGYTLGTGVAFRLGKANLFAEYGFHSVAHYQTWLTPLTIGLRF